jgi:hypothetical protein
VSVGPTRSRKWGQQCQPRAWRCSIEPPAARSPQAMKVRLDSRLHGQRRGCRRSGQGLPWRAPPGSSGRTAALARRMCGLTLSGRNATNSGPGWVAAEPRPRSRTATPGTPACTSHCALVVVRVRCWLEQPQGALRVAGDEKGAEHNTDPWRYWRGTLRGSSRSWASG